MNEYYEKLRRRERQQREAALTARSENVPEVARSTTADVPAQNDPDVILPGTPGEQSPAGRRRLQTSSVESPRNITSPSLQAGVPSVAIGRHTGEGTLDSNLLPRQAADPSNERIIPSILNAHADSGTTAASDRKTIGVSTNSASESQNPVSRLDKTAHSTVLKGSLIPRFAGTMTREDALVGGW